MKIKNEVLESIDIIEFTVYCTSKYIDVLITNISKYSHFIGNNTTIYGVKEDSLINGNKIFIIRTKEPRRVNSFLKKVLFESDSLSKLFSLREIIKNVYSESNIEYIADNSLIFTSINSDNFSTFSKFFKYSLEEGVNQVGEYLSEEELFCYGSLNKSQTMEQFITKNMRDNSLVIPICKNEYLYVLALLRKKFRGISSVNCKLVFLITEDVTWDFMFFLLTQFNEIFGCRLNGSYNELNGIKILYDNNTTNTRVKSLLEKSIRSGYSPSNFLIGTNSYLDNINLDEFSFNTKVTGYSRGKENFFTDTNGLIKYI